MSFRKISSHLGLTLLLIQAGLSQQTVSNDDTKTMLKECRIIRMVLSARERQRTKGDVPGNDDFTAAGKGCDRLDAAMAASDPGQIQSAAGSLRVLLARLGRPPASPKEQLAALEKKTTGLSGPDLFYQLPDLAKRAFNAGEIEKAEAYSNQLLQLAAQYPKNPNRGHAVFYGNLILGRIAARRGDLAQAGQYLMAAGATTGSPSLDSFGPNMSLANDLLDKGQSGVVLRYFALCKNFWSMDNGKLDEWSAVVRGGGVPDFGANLDY